MLGKTLNKEYITNGDESNNIIGNLSPNQSSIKEIRKLEFKNNKKNLSLIDISRSPQNVINDFIKQKISGFNIAELYADPKYVYESEYTELVDFREELFNKFNASFNINQYITANKDIFNPFLIEAIKKIVPARITFGNIEII